MWSLTQVISCVTKHPIFDDLTVAKAVVGTSHSLLWYSLVTPAAHLSETQASYIPICKQ